MFRTFHILTHDDVGIAVNITLHTISGTIDVEAGVFRFGSQRIVRIFQFLLILTGKHVAPEIDGNVASHGSRLVAAAEYVSSHIGIVLLLWLELVLDGELDERFGRVGTSQ